MADLQPLVEDEGERPEVEVLDSLVGRHVKVTTKAKRAFTGTLVCIDHMGHLLMFDALEEVQSGKRVHQRHLNQIILALEKVSSVQVLVMKDDEVLKIMLEDELKQLRV